MRYVKEIRDVDVCLVMAPTATFNQPSLALGILKSCLEKAGIPCYVDYATVYFGYELGQESFHYLFSQKNKDILEEYLFADLAGIKPDKSQEDVVAVLADPEDPEDQERVRKEIIRALGIAKECVKHTVDRLLERHPSVIGCSITFRQLNASMAILKRVKEIAPHITAVVGGSRCAGEAGIAIMRAFPYVDYVFFGEGDENFAPAVSILLGKDKKDLPYGVVKNQLPYPKSIPYRITKDLNTIPYPNFDEFFDLLSLPQGKMIYDSSKEKEVVLSAEMSRGCWWGEKHPCTFCGLNGSHNRYRQKSARRVIDEVRYLSERYGLTRVQFTDCILPREMLKELYMVLAEENFTHEFYAEVRPNISERKMREYHTLGFRRMQPGIESLSDEHLKLMNKGVTAIQNIYTMKLARQYDIDLVWNLLVALPGETVHAYEEQLEIIPLIEHLMPPTGVRDIIFAKDSVYYNEPERFGLSLIPDEKYQFGASEKTYIEDIALDFQNSADYRNADCVEEEKNLSACVNKWKKEFRKNWQKRKKKYYGTVCLELKIFEHTVQVTDTRGCSIKRDQVFSGLAKELLIICMEPISWENILKLCTAREDEVRKVLHKLLEHKMILKIEKRYLTLAVLEE